MDAVAGLLDGPRAREAFLLRSTFDPPWGVSIRDEAPLTLVAVVRGTARLRRDGAAPVALAAGDVCVVRGPDHYDVTDRAGSPVAAVIHPGQRCAAPDGTPLDDMAAVGVRAWGNATEGTDVLLTGTYDSPGATSRRLLDALPGLLVVRGEEWESPLVALLVDELGREGPGQDAVLDRLLDVLLVSVLRQWFARPDAHAPGWYAAHADPLVGPALRRIHEAPAAPWSVASLAREAGLSRAAFARRFGEAVGEPPMAYLTAWRLALAADLLREPGTTIAAVAERVGYSSPFALSAAFKRVRGVSPAAHRAGAAA